MSLNPLEVINKASEIANKLHAAEKFAIPVLQVRAMRAAERHPADQTLRMMHNVLQRMNEHGNMFITRADLRSLYNKFATSNNKAAGYFAEELQLAELPKAKVMKYSEDANVDLVSEAMKSAADPAILNALADVWNEQGKINKKAELRGYDPEQAKKATTLVTLALSRIGSEPAKVNHFGGSTGFIICDASYQTQGGEAHVLIPVELTASGALIPNMFLSKHGFVDLTKNAVAAHIAESAGNNLRVNASELLNTLHSMKKLASMDEVELQISIAQAAFDKSRGFVKEASENNEQVSLSSNPVFLQEIDPQSSTDVVLPDSEDKQSFASALSSPKGVAEHVFGKDVITAGRNLVVNRFRSCGHNPQIAVVGCDDDSISYAVRLDANGGPLGFQVLVSVGSKKRLGLPNIIAANDKVYEFSREGISDALNNKSSDISMVAAVSPMYDLKASDVLQRLRTAADNKDFRTAEEALHVLAEKAPGNVYAMAVAEYMRSLSGAGMTKKASTASKCRFIVKTANHNVPVCGHLNLPLNKVYQDEHGECRPLYRKSMEETYEGMLLNTSKIFL